MSDLPISSPYRSTPGAPVSDAERNQLNVRLNDAFAAGALDPDDYQQRLDGLFAARRMGELAVVVEGLPPLQTYRDPAIVASVGGRPGELTEARPGHRLTLAVVSSLAVVLVVVLLLIVASA